MEVHLGACAMLSAMSNPSEKAIEAAMGARSKPGGEYNGKAVEVIAAALHDPALGLDRSVCLRDVVEALAGGWDTDESPSEFIEREFGS